MLKAAQGLKINQHSLSELVLDPLRLDIIRGVYKPGSHLVERTLAEQYGVSRGPIREALTELEREGLVQILPRRGAIVTELSPREAWEIYTLRGHLEQLAVKQCEPQLTKDRIDKLLKLVQEMEELEEADIVEAVMYDLRFHRAVVQASGNNTLIRTHRTLDAKVGACFLLVTRHLGYSPTDMAERHRPLAEAIAQRDIDRAQRLAKSHWHNTAEQFLKTPSGGG